MPSTSTQAAHGYSRGTSLIALLAIGLALVLGCFGAVRAEDAVTPRQLIADLGSSEFAVRQAAETALFEMGEAAMPHVQAAARSPDPEIRKRAAHLMGKLSKTVRQDKLTRFTEGAEGVRLPGWERFRKSHDDNPAMRKLYVEMLKEEWSLLEMLDSHPAQIDYIFYQRAAVLRQRMYGGSQEPIRLGSIAAMLHAAAQEDAKITPLALGQIQFLLASPSLTQSLQDPQTSGPLIAVFEHWLNQSLEQHRLTEHLQFLILMMCMRENLSSGMILCKAILNPEEHAVRAEYFAEEAPTGNSMLYQIYAVLGIAKLGSKRDIPYLESLFDDPRGDRSFQLTGNPLETQLRDVALLAVIHLSGEDPSDFGFSRLTTDPNSLYSYRSIGFGSAEERNTAFQKWAQRKQPDTPPVEKVEPTAEQTNPSK